MNDVMTAVIARDYGPPEQFALAELPIPHPGPGQLQVRVAAASLNPADLVLPGGDFRDTLELPFPHVPGNNFAGTVTEVGLGVTGYAVGDEVFGLALPRVLRPMADPARPSLGTGMLARYAVVEADTPLIAHRPSAVSTTQAAALATAGLTALALLAQAEVLPGERILVVGAGGGVGTTLLPPLAAAGAHVIATGTAEETALLRRLGATEVIDYRHADVPAVVRASHPDGVDAVLNLVLPSDRLTGLGSTLRAGGRLLTITFPPPGEDAAGRPDVTVTLVLDMAGRLATMRDVAEEAAAGRLRATVGRSYPFAEAVAACTDFARRHTTGKLVVTLD
ncbi:NADPH:quinone reductase-like Zn-dependent oxidoreductase [Kitasatospora sp. GP30]|uniref:NADP-dependent oxidoreductase n=1 Tax=Kitasatospora sp. GP30 TaxID=3035084 RepID=UPI0024748CFB|nr:NADP-dependent oxidoreductase [Kitasatospora sp. GP30]MDH6140315.1 NADPH:quinone reductase-like Zn-dependent oxidoreductase [Kitasatospora sp. GP30]